MQKFFLLLLAIKIYGIGLLLWYSFGQVCAVLKMMNDCYIEILPHSHIGFHIDVMDDTLCAVYCSYVTYVVQLNLPRRVSRSNSS